MKAKGMLTVFMLCLLTICQLSASENGESLNTPPLIESPAGYSSPAMFLPITIGSIVAVGGLGSVIACSAAYTSLYLQGAGQEEALLRAMIASVTIFNIVIAGSLTAIESMSAAFYTPAIIGPISATLAFASLVPAVILTDRHIRLGDNSRELMAGLTWSWSAFGSLLIPAITGGVIGLVFASFNRHWSGNVSLLLAPDRIGVTINI